VAAHECRPVGVIGWVDHCLLLLGVSVLMVLALLLVLVLLLM